VRPRQPRSAWVAFAVERNDQHGASSACSRLRTSVVCVLRFRLRKAVSDLTLDKLILQEAARGNF
jgi:hypothetical protein